MLVTMKSRFDKLNLLIQNLLWILNISYNISKKKFILRILVTILYAGLPMLSYWMLKIIIDSALSPSVLKDITPLLLVILLKLVFDLGWNFLDTLLEGLFKIMRFDMEKYFVALVTKKLNTVDLGFYENSNYLDLKQKTLDTYAHRPTEFLNVAFWSLYNVFQVVFQSIILITINPLWLILLFLFQIPALTILLKIGQSAWNIWDADSTTRRKFTYFSGLFNNIAYIKEFALYQVGDYFIGKILSGLDEFHTNQKRIEKKRVLQGFGGSLLSNLPVFYITFSLLFMTVKREITPGLLTFYLGSLSAFALALQNLVKNINFGFEVNLYVKEIRKFLNLKSRIRSVTASKNNKYDLNDLTIEFDKVWFSYPESKRVIFTDFSLRIDAKKKIALVGENGSGKTTLIKLLCRFYDVQRGSIRINGMDIREIPLSTLRSWFAVLFQDFVGYDLTVNENIAMGRISSLSDKNAIKKAAGMSGADIFIDKLPHKYNQLLGSSFAGGEQLSIGQWQRIALAKAFMRDSPIVILDEPTAAVDAKTENEIFNKVMTLVHDKTVVMISHRFSTVRKADEILVLQDGKIIERGTHDELLAVEGEYATMFRLQAEAYQ